MALSWRRRSIVETDHHRHDRRRCRRPLPYPGGAGRPARRPRRRRARSRGLDQGRHAAALPARGAGRRAVRGAGVAAVLEEPNGSPDGASPRSCAAATSVPPTSSGGCWNLSSRVEDVVGRRAAAARRRDRVLHVREARGRVRVRRADERDPGPDGVPDVFGAAGRGGSAAR